MLGKQGESCFRLSQRPPGSAADADEVAQAFKPWLPGVLGMAFSTGGRTDQVCKGSATQLLCRRLLLVTCLELVFGLAESFPSHVSSLSCLDELILF